MCDRWSCEWWGRYLSWQTQASTNQRHSWNLIDRTRLSYFVRCQGFFCWPNSIFLNLPRPWFCAPVSIHSHSLLNFIKNPAAVFRCGSDPAGVTWGLGSSVVGLQWCDFLRDKACGEGVYGHSELCKIGDCCNELGGLSSQSLSLPCPALPGFLLRMWCLVLHVPAVIAVGRELAPDPSWWSTMPLSLPYVS